MSYPGVQCTVGESGMSKASAGVAEGGHPLSAQWGGRRLNKADSELHEGCQVPGNEKPCVVVGAGEAPARPRQARWGNSRLLQKPARRGTERPLPLHCPCPAGAGF